MNVQRDFFLVLPVDELAIDELSKLALQLDMGMWKNVSMRQQEFKKVSYAIWQRSGFEQPLGKVLMAYLLTLPADNSAASAELRAFVSRIKSWQPKKKEGQ